MTTKTTKARSRTASREPKSRKFGPSDPLMWAGMTLGQIMNTRYLLTSGWYMHEAANGNDQGWWEPSEIPDDLSVAWNRAFAAERVGAA